MHERGPRRRPQLAWVIRARRGRRAGHIHMRVPEEPGRSCCLRSQITGGGRSTKVQARESQHSVLTGANTGEQVRYRQAKETKCGGTEGRAWEHLIVLWTRGNGPRPDPVEERRCRVMEPFEGNMASASKLGTVSMRQERIANRQRSHDLTSRMRQSRTYGSVGALGGQPPRATRPVAPVLVGFP